MKPSLREDLTAISAIGAGTFVSGVLTAVLLAGTSGHDRNFELVVGAAPHVEVHWEAQEYAEAVVSYEILMAGPEGLHSGWFPSSEEPQLRKSSKAHMRLEAPHNRITIHRHP